MRMLAIAAVAGLLSIGSAAASDGDRNKQVYRDYLESAINHRQPESIDRYLAPDFVEHNPNLPPGLAGRKQFIQSVLAGFSDYHGQIEEILAEGDKVVTRTVWTGTQDGPFLGRPPTGNRLSFHTADFFRFENGKIAEHWDVVDSLPRALALGLVAPVPQATAPKSP